MTNPTNPVTATYVSPGAPVAVQAQVPAGMLFKNTDNTRAIWLGGPSVAPGSGLRLNPQATVTWATRDQPVYACVDAGVTVPVPLLMTTSLTELNDPVAVQIALAAVPLPVTGNVGVADNGLASTLNSKGIPSIQQSAYIQSGGFGSNKVFPNLSGYNSLLINMAGSSTGPSNLVLNWYDPTGTLLLASDSLSMTTLINNSSNQWYVPVKSSYLVISTSTGFAGTIVGTTRVVAQEMVPAANMSYVSLPSTTYANGQQALLMDTCGVQGMAQLAIRTSAGVSGNIFFVGRYGILLLAAFNSSQSIVLQPILPFEVGQIMWAHAGASATYVITAALSTGATS